MASSSSLGTSSGWGLQQASTAFRLQDLPDTAVQLIAVYASSPRTPGVCLMPMVCRGWQAAADRVQPLIDIRLELLPQYWDPQVRRLAGLLRCENRQQLLDTCRTTEELLAAVAAAPRTPPPPRGGPSFVAWLVKNRTYVRSLCIPLQDYGVARGAVYPACKQNLTGIMEALMGQQQGTPGGAALPHLVQLELPVPGQSGIDILAETLAGCCSLQQLRLVSLFDSGRVMTTAASALQMSPALGSLKQLKSLHLEGGDFECMPGPELASLLQQLPPSLERINLEGIECEDSIPLSCVSHLVNLKEWEELDVPSVVDDISSTSSSTSSGSSSSSCNRSQDHQTGLTALTLLRCMCELQSTDVRLQPTLRALHFREAEPAVWERLRAMKHLRHVTLAAGSRDTEDSAGLSDMKQVQGLELNVSPMFHQNAQPWAAAIKSLTQLTSICLTDAMLLAGGAALLAPLTRLEELTVKCTFCVNEDFFPEGAQDQAATSADAVVQVVAAAVAGGGSRLQRLVLRIGWFDDYPGRAQRWTADFRAALPGIAEVTVCEG